MKLHLLGVLTLFLCSGAASAQAPSGEMFGYRIGDLVENFDRTAVWFELIGLPWVERKPHEAANEFGRLQLLVTPFTGTILGMRAIADFNELAAADEFAQRLDAALSAKFGPDIFFHFGASDLSDCPDDEVRYVCTILPPDIDLYRARISNYEIQLSRYGDPPDDPTVYLSFVLNEQKPENKHYFDQLNNEYSQYEDWYNTIILNREKDGVLRGIE